MKAGIERLRQQKADQEKKVAAAADKLAGLKETHADMEARIDAAIAAGDQATAEKLIRNRNDVAVQLEVAEKTLALLQKPIDRAAAAAAWKDDLSDYQKQVDKAEKELAQLIRQVVEKALVIADTVNSSWEARADVLRLVDDQDPYSYNVGNRDFDGITFTAATLDNLREMLSADELNRIRPDAEGTLSLATRSRNNIYFGRK